MKRRKAVIFDLDGTLYDCTDRRDKYMTEDSKDFDGFHKAAVYDKPNKWCAKLCRAMYDAGYKIVFMSGRPEKYRAETEAWISEHLGWAAENNRYVLYMRPDGDSRKDALVKAEIFIRDIEPVLEVIFCVDDRQQVVDMWRGLGLTALQCDTGKF